MLIVEEEIKEKVISDVNEYFKRNKMRYTTFEILRKSNHLDDKHLFMVIAINLNSKEYAVWTSWNNKKKSLNHGHYGIKDLNDCIEIIKKNTHLI